MKKASKPITKKPAQKKPTTKKPSAKPKRKARSGSEFTQVVARLEAVADKLAEAVERLGVLAPPIEIRTEEVVIAAAPEEGPLEEGPENADVSREQ